MFYSSPIIIIINIIIFYGIQDLTVSVTNSSHNMKNKIHKIVVFLFYFKCNAHCTCSFMQLKYEF